MAEPSAGAPSLNTALACRSLDGQQLSVLAALPTGDRLNELFRSGDGCPRREKAPSRAREGAFGTARSLSW